MINERHSPRGSRSSHLKEGMCNHTLYSGTSKINNRHIGMDHFVHYREVVPIWTYHHYIVQCIRKCPLYIYHKGAIAPLYIGMARVSQHRSHTYVPVAIGTQSGICFHKRVPMVKIWGSSKNDQNRITGKLLKL